jgi:hypothetical protein
MGPGDDTFPPEASNIREMFANVPEAPARAYEGTEELHGRGGVKVNGDEIRGDQGPTGSSTDSSAETFLAVVVSAAGFPQYARVGGAVGELVPLT